MTGEEKLCVSSPFSATRGSGKSIQSQSPMHQSSHTTREVGSFSTITLLQILREASDISEHLFTFSYLTELVSSFPVAVRGACVTSYCSGWFHSVFASPSFDVSRNG